VSLYTDNTDLLIINTGNESTNKVVKRAQNILDT